MTAKTTDRELLELAAKAADMRYHDWTGAGLHEQAVHGVPHCGYDGSPFWNPLTDDGDALRLAVKLGLFTGPEFFHFRSLERFAGQDADDYTANRRAIVRAAAEIGSAMP